MRICGSYSAQFSHFFDVGSMPDISQLIPECRLREGIQAANNFLAVRFHSFIFLEDIMSVIALNNRVTTHSGPDVAFASCTALPIHQTTLNFEEMAGIDGLWDWGDFFSCAGEGAFTGAIGGAVGGAFAGGLPGALVGVVTGATAGAAAGAAGYVWDEFVGDF